MAMTHSGRVVADSSRVVDKREVKQKLAKTGITSG